jgi:hypothetical protein
MIAVVEPLIERVEARLPETLKSTKTTESPETTVEPAEDRERPKKKLCTHRYGCMATHTAPP